MTVIKFHVRLFYFIIWRNFNTSLTKSISKSALSCAMCQLMSWEYSLNTIKRSSIFFVLISLEAFLFHSMLHWARAIHFFSWDSSLDLLEHCLLRGWCWWESNGSRISTSKRSLNEQRLLLWLDEWKLVFVPKKITKNILHETLYILGGQCEQLSLLAW